MQLGSYLGQVLKLLRTRRGWPQKQLAAAAGVSKSMVSSYERGKQMPNLTTVDKLMTALEADLCDVHCAFEHLFGRPMTVHPLSAHFQPEGPRPHGAIPPNTRAAAVAAEITEVARGGPWQPSAPEPLDRLLDNIAADLRELLRYTFLGR